MYVQNHVEHSTMNSEQQARAAREVEYELRKGAKAKLSPVDWLRVGFGRGVSNLWGVLGGVHAWKFVSIKVMVRGGGDYLAILTVDREGDGEREVAFGGGVGVIEAIVALNKAVSKDAYKKDKPWGADTTPHARRGGREAAPPGAGRVSDGGGGVSRETSSWLEVYEPPDESRA